MPVYTAEFVHAGRTRLIEIGASAKDVAIKHLQLSLRSALEGGATLKLDTFKEHKDSSASAKFIAGYRRAKGLPPLSDETLVRNQLETFGKPEEPEPADDAAGGPDDDADDE